MIRAPIETSLSTKKRRLSNIFSKISTVPRACVATTTAIDVRSAGNAGHGPSSTFGIAPPRSSTIASCWSGGTRSQSSPSSTPQPAAQLVAAVELDRRAELGERVHVRIEPAPADDVTARRRHARTAEAREQRPGDQERRADAAREVVVRLVRDLLRVNSRLVRP